MNIETRVAVCAACDLAARLQVELMSQRRTLSDWQRLGTGLAIAGPTSRSELLLLRQSIDVLEAAIEELACEHEDEPAELEDADDVAA